VLVQGVIVHRLLVDWVGVGGVHRDVSARSCRPRLEIIHILSIIGLHDHLLGQIIGVALLHFAP
jgi:hypothetical protein